MAAWTPYAKEYDPVMVGSIDGTDTDPHDHGIVRALQSTYKPNKGVEGEAKCTIVVARLNHVTTQDTLKESFSKYGDIRSIKLVRDIVTGFSKGYAFIEYYDEADAAIAHREGHQMIIDDKEVLVDFECERVIKGWIPRRMGGGFGGKKESGQLRFGGRDRPFRKPILVDGKITNAADDDDSYRQNVDRGDAQGYYRNKYSDRKGRSGPYSQYSRDRRTDRSGQYNRRDGHNRDQRDGYSRDQNTYRDKPRRKYYDRD